MREQYMFVTADVLNGRAGPGMEYPIIKKERRGARLFMIALSGDYNAASYRGRSVAWFHRSYLSAAAPDLAVATLPPVNHPLVVYATRCVKTSIMRGRIGPGDNFPVHGELEKLQTRSDSVYIVSAANHYVATLEAGGGVIWVPDSYLLDGDSYENAPPLVNAVVDDGFRWEAWPTAYMEAPGGRSPINQAFGANPDIYLRYGLPGHEGVDLFLEIGSPVFAVAPGIVYSVHTDGDSHNYGIHVRVRHKDGYRSVYCHLSEPLVSIGDVVEAGQQIGKGGNTGNVWPRPTAANPDSGKHLHLTMKRAVGNTEYPYQIIDPTPFIDDYLNRN